MCRHSKDRTLCTVGETSRSDSQRQSVAVDAKPEGRTPKVEYVTTEVRLIHGMELGIMVMGMGADKSYSWSTKS